MDGVDPVGVLGAPSRRRDGLASVTARWSALFIALQFLSSIYYGIFLATLVALVGGLAPVPCAGSAVAAGDWRRWRWPRRSRARCSRRTRFPTPARSSASEHDPGTGSEFSARPSSYLVATDTNYLYGERIGAARAPGATAVSRRCSPCCSRSLGCSCDGRRARRSCICFALVAAFEMSLGLYGYSFTVSVRSRAAFSTLCARPRVSASSSCSSSRCSLRTAMRRSRSALARRWTRALTLAIAAVLLARVLGGAASPRAFPERRRRLSMPGSRQQPRGVVAEFPMPMPDTLPGHEPRYAYMSTFHWMPLLNGYSGYYPPSYLTRLSSLRTFPRCLHRCAASAARHRDTSSSTRRSIRADRAGEVLSRAIDSTPHSHSWAISTMVTGRGVVRSCCR